MIVTRRRKPRAHPARIIVPLLIVALVGFVIGFPPTRTAIAGGPLLRPLTFAGQQEALTQRNREIRDLNARLTEERKAREGAEARAQQLEQQLSALADQPIPTAMPAPRRIVTAATTPASAAGANDDRRLAATWAAMEPEKAAALVQRLPDAQAGRVLAQMDAESAGAILDALPSSVAARISRAQAQVH